MYIYKTEGVYSIKMQQYISGSFKLSVNVFKKILVIKPRSIG